MRDRTTVGLALALAATGLGGAFVMSTTDTTREDAVRAYLAAPLSSSPAPLSSSPALAPGAAAYPSPAPDGGIRYAARIDRWVDGDTVSVTLRIRARPDAVLEDAETIRLAHVDTPEIRGASRGAGMKAKVFVSDLAPVGESVTVTIVGEDKYGRALASVVEAGGVDLSDALLSSGSAKPYEGGAR